MENVQTHSKWIWNLNGVKVARHKKFNKVISVIDQILSTDKIKVKQYIDLQEYNNQL